MTTGDWLRLFQENRPNLLTVKEDDRALTQALTHELKSPLAAIRGSAELLFEPVPDKQRARFLGNILEETRRTETVLEQMLRIAALESQRALTETRVVSLADLVVESESALMGIAEKLGVGFSNRWVSPPKAEIEIDPFLVGQALRNVLQNAVEFSKQGGTVEIELVVAEDEARVIVEDRGAGIPDFAQKRIFEKFFSLERPRTGKKGTGLGLSFVREVVLLHRGSIRVSSPLHEGGSGTKVEISLPRRQR